MKSFRSCSAWVLGFMVGSVWACDAGTDDAEDDSSDAGKGGSAGRGGAQNESGGGAQNTGGAAGAGGSFIYDEDLCDCSLDDEGKAICTIAQDEFHARIPIPGGCDDYIVEIETSECDDGTTRVRWIEDFDQAYLVVSETASGERVYGRGAPYQDVCDTGDRFEILSYGAAPSGSVSCERTEYCCGDDDFCGDRGTAGAGGEAGSGR